jgi:hypothetical protein
LVPGLRGAQNRYLRHYPPEELRPSVSRGFALDLIGHRILGVAYKLGETLVHPLQIPQPDRRVTFALGLPETRLELEPEWTLLSTLTSVAGVVHRKFTDQEGA